METLLDRFEATLRQYGKSITKPRETVFKAFLKSNHPLAVSEIVGELSDKVDRASVYRIIELFEKLGILQRLQLGWKYKLELSDIFSPHHHHLVCNNCGKIIPLEEDPLLEKYLAEIANMQNFSEIRHHLELSGTCPDCKTKSTL